MGLICYVMLFQEKKILFVPFENMAFKLFLRGCLYQ